MRPRDLGGGIDSGNRLDGERRSEVDTAERLCKRISLRQLVHIVRLALETLDMFTCRMAARSGVAEGVITKGEQSL